MSENGHDFDSFPDGVIFTNMFNDITDRGKRRVRGKCLDSAKEVASYAARLRPVIGVSVVQDRNRIL